jgi:hypothetical protein
MFVCGCAIIKLLLFSALSVLFCTDGQVAQFRSCSCDTWVVGGGLCDEVRPKSGYSIYMIVHDSSRVLRDERSKIAGMWAVEFGV